jgi:hypothetical protein
MFVIPEFCCTTSLKCFKYTVWVDFTILVEKYKGAAFLIKIRYNKCFEGRCKIERNKLRLSCKIVRKVFQKWSPFENNRFTADFQDNLVFESQQQEQTFVLQQVNKCAAALMFESWTLVRAPAAVSGASLFYPSKSTAILQ